MDDLPRPIGDDIDRILDQVLPEHIARERGRLLREHTEAVLEIRDRHRRAWEEMLGAEVAMLILSGLPEGTACVAAQNNLALRKRTLDAELATELGRLQGELGERLLRLVEDAADERADQGDQTPAP